MVVGAAAEPSWASAKDSESAISVRMVFIRLQVVELWNYNLDAEEVRGRVRVAVQWSGGDGRLVELERLDTAVSDQRGL